MDAKFSQRIKDVLSYSKEEAVRLGNAYIGTEHLFLGILREGEGIAINILENLNINLVDLKTSIEQRIKSDENFKLSDSDNIPLFKTAERALKLVYLEARSFNSPTVNTGHLLLAILKDENSVVTQFLEEKSINYQTLRSEMETIIPEAKADFEDEENEIPFGPSKGGSHGSSQPGQKSKSETPVLDNFGIDLTKAAEDNALDPIVGREKEIERLAQILSRRKKNNPVLIGEPGVGKSAIVEGLALRIIQRKVSRVLFDKRVITLDLASIVAGTKYRGQFEERMKAILNELSKNANIILFIDEIHTIVGAGGATGSLDAANMLKPALARGEIQTIGATTLDEYRQHIEKDGALERRFQKIMVEPTSVDETFEILNNIKSRYEDHHYVIFTPEALNACVKLTARYISDRYLPDKAIDALDEVGSRVHISNINVPDRIIKLEEKIEKTKEEKITAVKSQDFERAANFRDNEKNLLQQLDKEKENWEKELVNHRETVDEEKVAEVVAMMSGVPVQRIAQAEGKRLMNMEKDLKSRVVGQEDAIKKIVKAIQRNRAGLKDPNRPIGSFIFLGPTGVGKTQLAKVLATYLFDSLDSLIRMDMSEDMDKFSVSRLVGAPPGYVGYEEGGQLTEKGRRKPDSVVRLAEIEKAHPDVFNILLQVLDDGILTDGNGRRVDFRNTIIIMTSNIGTQDIKSFGKGIGFSQSEASDDMDYNTMKSTVEDALKNVFNPEFLNRIDDVIVFHPLNKENIFEIIDIMSEDLFERAREQGLELSFDESAKEFLTDKGFDPKYGARPLQRALQKYVEDPMAEDILHGATTEGDSIVITQHENGEELDFKVEKGEAPPETADGEPIGEGDGKPADGEAAADLDVDEEVDGEAEASEEASPAAEEED